MSTCIRYNNNNTTLGTPINKLQVTTVVVIATKENQINSNLTMSNVYNLY